MKLDIGCGKNKRDGFTGIDRREFPGVDIIHDICSFPWPIETASVDEVHCSHVLEHLDHNRHNPERVKFMNELYRVMMPETKALIITPHWASNRAFGDFTHADKPVSEMFYYYVSREWRLTNAPDTDVQYNSDGFNCDFQATWGYSMLPQLMARSDAHQRFALENYKDAALDIIATLTKR